MGKRNYWMMIGKWWMLFWFGTELMLFSLDAPGPHGACAVINLCAVLWCSYMDFQRNVIRGQRKGWW